MPSNLQVLGTIIASVLDYDKLCQQIGEPAVVSNPTSTYIPCDGRSIQGSKLALVTGKTNAPDLRGKFIRGLNTIYNVGQLPFDPLQFGDPDGTNRIVGDYQPDGFKQHQHHYTHFDGNVVSDYSDDQDHRKASYGNMIGDDTKPAGESKYETRVRNVSVYHYIKIN